MDKTRNRTKKEIIQELQSCLNWYACEASDEEYNEEEAHALDAFLQVMDPIDLNHVFFDSGRAMKRFDQYYKPHMEGKELQDSKVIMSFEDRLASKQAKAHIELTRRLKPLMKYSWVAVLVVAMFMGGTVGAFAQKQGFFQILESDKEAMITSPNGVDASTVFQHEYESIDQVPIQYLGYVWAPSGEMQIMDLQYVGLADNSKFVKSECFFKTEDSFVMYIRKSYKDSVTGIDQIFDLYDLHSEEIIEDVKVKFYKNINEDYTEYIATFIYGNSLYNLHSNLDIDTIKEMIYDSIINLVL